jgi:hypothetical protein
MRRPLTFILLLVTLTACVRHTTATGGLPTPEGPPEIRYDVVRQHALQFDVDIPDRPPGSQHELAAASYILGHLQLAGYSPRLDSVPVKDAVNSTNVVAFPPNGSKPKFLVTIPYDTGDPTVQKGHELGLFLELARALTVANPDHQVGFVALGAESADARGSRRLAQFLLDEDVDPSVILIKHDPSVQGSFYTFGACMGPVEGGIYASSFTDSACRDMDAHNSVFSDAGFQFTFVAGDIQRMGTALFDFLTRSQS